MIVEDISDKQPPTPYHNKETFAVKQNSEETMHEPEDLPVKLAKPAQRKYATAINTEPSFTKVEDLEQLAKD